MIWKLFTYPGNPRAFKVLITARYNGVDIECATDFKFGIENKSPDFLKLNPYGTIPTLQTDQGGIWGSNAIVRFVARSGNKSMYGRNELDDSQIDAWMDWAENSLEPACTQLTAPILGFLPYNKKKEQEAVDKIQRELSTLDRHLLEHTFLVGEHISAADIVVLCTLLRLFTMYFDSASRALFRAVDRWFQTLLHQPNVLAVLGAVQLCNHKMEPKKFESQKKEKPTVKSTRTHAATNESASKSAQKKGTAKSEEDHKKEEKDDEQHTHENPTTKNALDLLPESRFVLDEWRRLFSNHDLRTVAMPWFWENYDPEGYCMYSAEYKHASDFKDPFVSSNIVSGFYQRLDELRKYGMGVTLILGTETEQQLQSCWIFRGNEIPPMVTQCFDSERWTWSKIDTNDTASRDRINDFFCCDRPIEGSPILESKVFK